MVDMPTATIATIDIDADDWTSLPASSGALVSVLQPKDYVGE
jgi:hypothetical protein